MTPDALRYYERLGLLPPPQRTSGGFRVYAAETLDKLRFIKQAQTLGLTLHEIGALVSYQNRDGLGRCREVRDLLRLKQGFDADDVSRRIRAAGDEHSRRLERPNDPPWVARWVSLSGQLRQH